MVYECMNSHTGAHRHVNAHRPARPHLTYMHGSVTGAHPDAGHVHKRSSRVNLGFMGEGRAHKHCSAVVVEVTMIAAKAGTVTTAAGAVPEAGVVIVVVIVVAGAGGSQSRFGPRPNEVSLVKCCPVTAHHIPSRVQQAAAFGRPRRQEAVSASGLAEKYGATEPSVAKKFRYPPKTLRMSFAGVYWFMLASLLRSYWLTLPT